MIPLFPARLRELIQRVILQIGTPTPLRFLFFYGAMAGLALWRGSRQDYGAYELQWGLVLAGKDPWTGHTEEWYRNAYGPVFNLLALPYWVHPLLPKLMFVAVWVGTAYFLLRRLAQTSVLPLFGAILLLVLNPFFIIETTELGHFDILVAAAFVFCLVFYQKRGGMNDLLAAIFFSIAVGLKFYPLVTLPFLWCGVSGMRHRFAILSALGIALIFFIGEVVWGPSVWAPLTFATAREVRHLSIFFSLDWLLSRLSLPPLPSWVWKLSLVIAGGILFLLHLRKRLPPEPACLTAFLVTFLFYAAGHHQFQIILFYLVVYWASNAAEITEATRQSFRPWIHYLIFLSIYILVYMLTFSFGSNYGWLGVLVPLPAFWLASRAVLQTLRTVPSIDAH
jgi:Glycosyltransferase family 87